MNRRIYKRVKMISIILSFCMLLLTACSKPVDRFKNAVKDGDYEKAIEVYENYINGDTGKEEVADLFMNEYLSQALEDYASGKGSASAYQKAFNTIDKIERGAGINTSADKINERFTKIKNSKSQYKNGKNY